MLDLGSIQKHSPQESRGELRGNLGTAGILITVVGFMAPLAGISGYVTLAIVFGNGLGAPLTFLFAGLLMALFAVGYLALVKYVPRSGAFYSYISAALGRPIGLGAAAISLGFYGLSNLGSSTYAGIQIQTLLQETVGLNAPWWIYSMLVMITVTIICLRGIDLSVRLLAIVVVIEVVAILVFNFETVFRGGPDGYLPDVLTTDAFMSGSLPAAFLFAISVTVGFEATAVFRSEARDHAKSIPRATYIVVVAATIFYAFSAWCLLVANGRNTVAAAAENPTDLFASSFAAAFGDGTGDFMRILVLISTLVSSIAIANVSARYLYSLGADHVLPRSIGVAHERWASPHRALICQAVVVVALLAFLIVSPVDSTEVFAVVGGVNMLAFEVMIFLVAISVIVYFATHQHDEPVWKVVIAPAITALALGALVVFTYIRIDLLIGVTSPITPFMISVYVALFVLGVSYATWAKYKNLDLYRRIGRVVDEK